MNLASSGMRRHYVTLANPGTPVSDGDGGATSTPVALTPAGVYAQVTPATARDLERLAAGTIVATGTHVVRMPYHAGVTTQTVVTFNGRRLAVTGVSNPEERNRETICVCAEVVD